jgi:hypothetical protein
MDKVSTKKPIQLIIAADEPALFFSSSEVAETYLEAEDVRSGVYSEAFGPNGEPFDIMVDRHDNVVVVKREGGVINPERLREIITRFVSAVGTPISSEATLSDLIKLCSVYVDDGV